MQIKRGVIILVILLLVPLINSKQTLNSVQEIIQSSCNDNTLLGKCNQEGSICRGRYNLLDLDKAEGISTLERNKEYLFYAIPSENCSSYRLELDKRMIPLQKTGTRGIVAQFVSSGEKVITKVKCDNKEISFNNSYLGDISQELRLYKDCSFCNCPKTPEEPSAKLSALSDQLLNALTSKSCNTVEDSNLKDYCYTQLNQCNEIKNSERESLCEKSKEFSEERTYIASINLNKINYKAYKCKDIEILRIGAGAEICEQDTTLCKAKCMTNKRNLKDISTSFKEFSEGEYQKIASAELIGTGYNYNSYQIFAQDMLFVFNAPPSVKKLKIELMTFPYSKYPLSATLISSTEGKSLLSTTNIKINIPPRFPTSPSQGTKLEFSIPVVDGKAAIYISGSVNQIKVSGAN